MKKEASKIILINQKREIFMYLRNNKPLIHPGYWDFIGGGLEDGENALEAALREASEELNCPVMDLKQIGKINSEQYNYKIFMFKGRILANKEEIKLYEGSGKFDYFEFDDLFKIKAPKHYKYFIKENRKIILE